jgi:ferric-dicitrate binding protein FerR (iron transport regulator)
VIEAGGHKALLTAGGQTVALSGQDERVWEEYVERAADGVDAIDTIKVVVPRGGEYRLRLGDGTVVWLNAESAIEYPRDFAQGRREVRVTGEAFFDVAHDVTHPFVVDAGGLTVTVLGTRFNVNSYADARVAAITLEEGSVEVCNSGSKVVLAPNHQALFDRDRGTVTVEPVADMMDFTAWIDGQFHYRSAELAVIFAALERWYDVDIVCDPASVARIDDITLTFNRSENLNTVLEALAGLTGISPTIDGGTVYIK